MVVSIAISIALAPALGVVGLALGIAIASWLEAIILFARLDRRVPTLDVAGIPAAGWWLPPAAAALARGPGSCWRRDALVLGPAPGKIGIAGELAVGGLAGGLVYLGLARLLRFPEVPTIVRLLRSALRRDPAA